MPIHTVLDPSWPQRVPANTCALGIMTKAPQPGKVKTRLVPPLTLEQAAALNICFLRDISALIAICCSESVHSSQICRARGVAIYTPLGAEAIYENILPHDFLLIPQRGKNFGERLFFAAEDLFAHGFASVCLINSDSPTVPASSFAEACGELQKPGDHIVLGPSVDGGYYLIGLKKLQRRLFEEIDWSTARVFAQTKQRAAELGIQVHELPAGFDVDDSASLMQLFRAVLDEDAGENIAPNTRKFLSSIAENESGGGKLFE